MSPVGQSPLEELSIQRFGGHTYAVETLMYVDTARTRILPNNPNRIFLAIINEYPYDLRVSTDPNMNRFSGWLIPAQGGVFMMTWEEDGESVGYELFGAGDTTSLLIRVREVIRS